MTMFLANIDPFARQVLCDRGVCIYSDVALGWNTLFYDFATGSLIAVFFYWILVRWPECKKRQRLKRSFCSHYRDFKLSCIQNFLAVADGGFDAGLPEELLSIEAFRRYFNQQVGHNKNRWHDVANNMSDYYLDSTLSRMEILRQEIAFLLHEIDLSATEASDLLKRLSHAITLQKNASTDYDSIKSFLGFFWELFAGWNYIEGYQPRDVVVDMTNSI